MNKTQILLIVAPEFCVLFDCIHFFPSFSFLNNMSKGQWSVQGLQDRSNFAILILKLLLFDMVTNCNSRMICLMQFLSICLFSQRKKH